MKRWTSQDLKDRILVIVPHSDDETLLYAGLIRHAVKVGKEIWVAVVTNGDYQAQDHEQARIRLSETLRAMEVLGLPKDHVIAMGYADTGMEREDSFLYRLFYEEDSQQLYPSSVGCLTYGIDGVLEDYHFQKHGVHGEYDRNGFCCDLKELLLDTRPQQIFTTSRYDVHGDHEALCLFLIEALQNLRGIELYEGMVHSPAGDLVWPKPLEGIEGTAAEAEPTVMEMPPGLEEITPLLWKERISLPVPEELDGTLTGENEKYRLIKSYESQMKADEEGVVEFLTAFARKDEIFWKVEV